MLTDSNLKEVQKHGQGFVKILKKWSRMQRKKTAKCVEEKVLV